MLSITGWMLVATGFTGALSARFVFDLLAKKAGFGSKTSIHLAPAGGTSSVLAGLIAKARKEVLLIIPAPRARQVVESLINACKKGVHVELLIDPAAPKVCPGECEMLRQAGATLLFDPDHSPIVGTQALIDHKTVALGAIRSGAPGEPDGLDNLTVLKGQPEEVNQFRDFFTTHKGHAQNLFAPAAQQAPAAPKPTAPVVQPQAPAQNQPQIIQQPISQPQAPPAQQATINPNDPASLLQAAREAAARGDQNRAAAYLEAAKNADRRMQEAAAAASGVRMPA